MSLVSGRSLLRFGNVFHQFLAPANVSVVQQSGFKVKTFLKLRCPHCYFIRVNGRLHVECNAQPRHKQREPMNVKQLW